MNLAAFDEYGEFEKNGNGTKYIAGIIYEGKEPDIRVERKRINSYLKAVCRDIGSSYPLDLHVDNACTNVVYVAKTKDTISHSLPEFIKQGTYKGSALMDNSGIEIPQRTGGYSIAAIVKSDTGKPDLLDQDVNQMVKDSFASNLYVHMMEDLLITLLFHNPMQSEIREIWLEIASRSLPGDIHKLKKNKEYEELGISTKKNSDKYKEANIDTYRTLIQREMIRTNSLYSSIKLNVPTINYEVEDLEMSFLYLADIICSLLHEKDETTDEERIEYINRTAYSITGREPFVKGYDSIDVLFERAWYKTEANEYLDAFELQYEAEHSESGFRNYYLNHWFPRIVKKIIAEKNTVALNRVSEDLYDKTLKSNINQNELRYLYEKLESVFERCKSFKIADRAWFYLNASGTAIWNHLGDSENARTCYLKNENYAGSIPLEDLIRWRNRWSVTCCDRFDFDQAVEETKKTIALAELYKELKIEFFSSTTCDLMLGLVKSQYGQCLAYKQSDEAEKYFLEALDEYEENSADYYITLSYLLHYYLEKRDKTKYEQYAPIYFGNHQDLLEQYRFICKFNRDSKYAFYIFVKACWLFYKEALPQAVLNAFRDIDKDWEMNGGGQYLLYHPWELSRKYLLLFSIEFRWNDSEQIYLRNLSDIAGKSEGIIREICDFGKIQYYNKKKKSGKRDDLIADLYSKMRKRYPDNNESAISSTEQLEWLKKKFTYTYI